MTVICITIIIWNCLNLQKFCDRIFHIEGRFENAAQKNDCVYAKVSCRK